MAERLKPVDVITVGVGLTGAIMAKELAATGLKVVGLERGPARDTVPDFQSPAIHDELRFAVRKALMQDNIKGQIQPGGNPFEGPRSREYPTPPMKEPHSGALFRKAAESLGYRPFPQPASTLSQPYTNPEGLTLQQCVFCGFCERFACEHF